LDFALRDCGIDAFIIVGVATEIGIEPTARHGADLGYIPVLVTDACGAGNEEAAARSIESLKFAGDALNTNTETICDVLRRRSGISQRVKCQSTRGRNSSRMIFPSFTV
jgi:nicotinamidase-related amidase